RRRARGAREPVLLVRLADRGADRVRAPEARADRGDRRLLPQALRQGDGVHRPPERLLRDGPCVAALVPREPTGPDGDPVHGPRRQGQPRRDRDEAARERLAARDRDDRDLGGAGATRPRAPGGEGGRLPLLLDADGVRLVRGAREGDDAKSRLPVVRPAREDADALHAEERRCDLGGRGHDPREPLQARLLPRRLHLVRGNDAGRVGVAFPGGQAGLDDAPHRRPARGSGREHPARPHELRAVTEATMSEHSEVRDGMRIDWDVPIEMDDGLVLRADVFRPVEDGRYAVLLSYGPYAKGLHFEDGYPDQWRIMCREHPDVPAGSTNAYQTWEVVDPEKWV